MVHGGLYLMIFNNERPRKTCFLVTLFLLASCGTKPATENTNRSSYYYTRGSEKYSKKEYKDSLRYLTKAITLAPENPKYMYELGRVNALLGRRDEAIEWLDRTVTLGFHFNVDSDGGYDAIRGLAEYRPILEKIQDLRRPIHNSSVVFRIAEKDLMPESIAYDEETNRFYVGSSYKRKVISIDSQGVTEDFISEGRGNLWSVWGMKVDTKRRVLWLVSSVYHGMKAFDARQFGMTGAYKYDLEQGKCLKEYILDERPKRHNLNDLVINARGDVFITDGEADQIWLISRERDKLEVFAKLANFSNPNGICLSEDERYLYVTCAEGICVLDVRTKEYGALGHPANVSLCGIDGLYFLDRYLVGIQVYPPQRVIQLILTANLQGVKRCRTIEVNNPLFDLPTTGVLIKDDFFYIANSQLKKFNDDGSIFPMETLSEIAILKTRLPR
jgi:tetratricopeptide (TPR) repeat protein